MKVKLKSKKLLIVAVILLIVVIPIYMVFAKEKYKNYSGDESFRALMGVMMNTIENQGEIELDQNEINALGSSYFKDGVKKGNLTINGFNMDIKKNTVVTLIPVKYKGLPLLLSSEGNFAFEEENIKYIPKYFKVGKITLPKDTVLNYIKNHFKGKVIVDGNNLIIRKSVLPSDIESFKFSEGKLILVAKKETKEVIAKTNESIKKIEQKVKEDANKQLENSGIKDEIINSSTGSDSRKESISNKGNKNTSKSSDGSLNKISKDLGSLYGTVSSQNGKQIVSIMNSTVNKLQNDSSYNFWGDAKNVMAIYKTLTPEEKKNFKTNLFNNVDLENALKLKDNYGM